MTKRDRPIIDLPKRNQEFAPPPKETLRTRRSGGSAKPTKRKRRTDGECVRQDDGES